MKSSAYDNYEELRCFVRFQRVFRNLLPLAEEALFKKLWREKYPQRNADGSFKYEWCAAMGAIFVDGTRFEVDVVLPGSFTAVGTKAVVVRATGQKAGPAAAGILNLARTARLLRRCFEADPSQRPTAAECEEELQAVYEAVTGKRYPSSVRAPRRRRACRA